MKTLLTSLLLLLMATTQAQDSPAVQLWAAANGQGMIHQSIPDAGEVPELRMEVRGKVRSLEVAAGYVAVFHDGEDLDGLNTLEVCGPKRIDDLSTMPMLGLRGNWNGAIASVEVMRMKSDDAEEGPIDPMIALEQR